MFLVFNGNTYYLDVVPSANRQAEGYLPASYTGTVNFNPTVNAEAPMGYAYSVTIPANTSATLRLPIADGLYVYESGQEAELAEGVTYIGTADGYAIYEVGSGSYLFSVSSEIPDGLKGLRGSKDSKDLRDPKDTVYSIDGKILPTDSVHGIVITGGKKIAVK